MSANASWKARTSGLLGVDEVAVHPVEQGVGGLVGDDVERQAGEDRAPGQVPAAVGPLGGEVAEQQGLARRVVVGVRLPQGVRVDRGAGGRTRPSAGRSGLISRSASSRGRCGAHRARPAQGPLELAIVFIATAYTICWWNRGSPSETGHPVLGQQVRVVQVDRRVEAPARRVVVDHLQVLADRARAGAVAVGEVPGEREHDRLGPQGVQVGGEQGVEREDPEPAVWGVRPELIGVQTTARPAPASLAFAASAEQWRRASRPALRRRARPADGAGTSSSRATCRAGSAR